MKLLPRVADEDIEASHNIGCRLCTLAHSRLCVSHHCPTQKNTILFNLARNYRFDIHPQEQPLVQQLGQQVCFNYHQPHGYLYPLQLVIMSITKLCGELRSFVLKKICFIMKIILMYKPKVQ